jgi:hypothetical protein
LVSGKHTRLRICKLCGTVHTIVEFDRLYQFRPKIKGSIVNLEKLYILLHFINPSIQLHKFISTFLMKLYLLHWDQNLAENFLAETEFA